MTFANLQARNFGLFSYTAVCISAFCCIFLVESDQYWC